MAWCIRFGTRVDRQSTRLLARFGNKVRTASSPECPFVPTGTGIATEYSLLSTLLAEGTSCTGDVTWHQG